ncbi:DUF1707 domain-containing protein [Amycolatopsis sp. PS_44_ISF1]|uniref:DUF1707 SHOCT-like domain-containing protein n=1 Tax=Amycolatopsis sp. PS_44_ISF1 TaxID=2974917 RepID=UPI0028E01AF1|nr:DUF1707 domain-containing protein [Amycolatopsis sp. PS_44_ISF1]MDT8909520.1 DUF1707 domain-containing protein [Amycolatopsis sp. PS_44_ISF1]
MRLSDDERQDALDVLTEHVRTGRLDVEEYGTRSAKVTAAKRVSDLLPLFDDLPSPRPSALLTTARPDSAPVPSGPAGSSALSRWALRSAVPIAVVLAIAVFILSRGRLILVFALPLAVLLITGWRRR